jgi:hypothetical protein
MKKSLRMFSVIGMVILMVVSVQKGFAQSSSGDTLKQEVVTLRDRVMGIEERITTAENDLAKLTKIKLSGYIQAQWENYENSSAYPYNYFSLRRVRLKVQYEPITGVAFVLQPDFVPGNISLKDAYVQLNEPWLKTFSLWAGQFNRPNFEVEYSSSVREVPERSRIIRALYPGERAIGAKLEIAPPKVPLLFQLAVLNGNDNLTIRDAAGVNINPTNKDFDPYKDLMARFVYTFRLGNFGALDLGVNGYYGKLKATSDTLLKSDYSVDKQVNVGSGLNRSWVGAELRLYMDIWGGLAIRSEWMMGVNAFPGYSSTASVTSPMTSSVSGDTLTLTALTTKTTSYLPNIRRNFMGGYVYLVKNIGKRHQIAVRWDYYDPNTKLKGDEIGVVKHDAGSSKSVTSTTTIPGSPTIIQNNTTKTVVSNTYKSGVDDIAYHTFTFAYNYSVTDNIRLQIAYEMPFNEKVGVSLSGTGNVTQKFTVNNLPGMNDYSTHVRQNVLTVRLQVKF